MRMWGAAMGTASTGERPRFWVTGPSLGPSRRGADAATASPRRRGFVQLDSGDERVRRLALVRLANASRRGVLRQRGGPRGGHERLAVSSSWQRTRGKLSVAKRG